mmetsp:Transcript_12490/g.29598  ORF Transcript_12490/g.29598 Transcript_12490/m.29598 type:complete len:183 (+) Transcript_12490:322-870(+)
MVSRLIFEDLNFDSFFELAPNRKFNRITPPIIRKKRVLFSERVKVVEIPSTRSLTRKDKKALWYSDPSEGIRKTSIIRQLLCVTEDDRDDTNESEDDCGFDHPEERKRLPVSAVLIEQRNQRESGVDDADFIAKIYQRCSAHSAMKAQIRAMQYEQEAREYVSADSSVRRKSKQLFRRILER